MKIISYVVLALFLAVAGLAATYYVKSGKQDATIRILADDLVKTRESLSQVETAVEESDVAIGHLAMGLSSISDHGHTVTERVVMMEKENAQVRDLLSMPLPDRGCLLDDTCDAVSAHQPE